MNSSACRCWLQNKSTLSEKKDDFHLKLLQFYTQKNNFLIKSQKLNVHTSRWFHVALVLVLSRNGRGERRLTSPLGGRWWVHRQGSRVAHASLWWNISSLLQMALAGRLSFSGEVQVFDWKPAWADIKKKKLQCSAKGIKCLYCQMVQQVEISGFLFRFISISRSFIFLSLCKAHSQRSRGLHDAHSNLRRQLECLRSAYSAL